VTLSDSERSNGRYFIISIRIVHKVHNKNVENLTWE